MCGAETSLLVSILVASAWARGAARESSTSAAALAHGTDPLAQIAEVAWSAVMWLKSVNQVVPAVLILLVGASPFSVLSTAFWTGTRAEGQTSWLGAGEIGAWRRFVLQLALLVWRAEKLENLMYRVKKSATTVRSTGLAASLQHAMKDPYGWVWPGLWGIARRAAMLVVSSLGMAPFIRTALPAVALDEGLGWVSTKAVDWLSKKVDLPFMFSTIIVPVVDALRFLPSVAQVFLLGILEYPIYPVGGHMVLLVLCTLAWTAHSCHSLWHSCWDIYDTAGQLWAQRGT